MRLAIIIIMVITAIGFVLTMGIESVSVIKGSHYVSGGVNCSDCHRGIAKEMEVTRALHGPHWDLSCEACHRYSGTGIRFANASNATPGREAHAAYIPSCLDCHGGKGAYVLNITGYLKHAPPARAFNITTTINHKNITIPSSIPYQEAHKQFIIYCIKLNDENIACLSCHTNFSINISYSYQDYIYFESTYWNVTALDIVGSKTYTVKVAKNSIFSGKHIFLPLNMINCSKCHYNIYLGLLNGSHAPVYYNSLYWGPNNLWGNPRYHARGYYNGTYVLTGQINNSYCNECHFAVNIPVTAASKGLVHCAEKVSCYTCHQNWSDPNLRWLDPYFAFINGTQSPDAYATYHENLLRQIAENYTRYIHGDMCMACHDASKHSGRCTRGCHEGNQLTYVYSEPD